VKFYRPKEHELAQWKEKAAPLIKSWVEDIESKGMPGRQTQETFARLRDKFQKEVTEKGYPWKRR
jgi:hypothetical protein